MPQGRQVIARRRRRAGAFERRVQRLCPRRIHDVFRRLLAPGGGAWGFLASDDDGRPLGALLLGECSAIYAGGAFGVVTELYVLPERRSEGVAPPLLAAARAFAAMEARDETLGIVEYQLGQTTLEEVFLRVAEEGETDEERA